MLKTLILCGGSGLRMRPYSIIVPKPLLTKPNSDKPLVEEMINHCNIQGLKDITLALSYKRSFIKAYCEDSKMNVKVIESEHSFDTAGWSRFYVDNKLMNETDDLLQLNGDISTDMNFNRMWQFHKDNKCDFTVAYKPYIRSIPFGNLDVDKDNNVVDMHEKPSFSAKITIGIYILTYKTIIEKMEKDEVIDAPTLIHRCINDKNCNIKGYELPADESWNAFEFSGQINNNENIENIK